MSNLSYLIQRCIYKISIKLFKSFQFKTPSQQEKILLYRNIFKDFEMLPFRLLFNTKFSLHIFPLSCILLLIVMPPPLFITSFLIGNPVLISYFSPVSCHIRTAGAGLLLNLWVNIVYSRYRFEEVIRLGGIPNKGVQQVSQIPSNNCGIDNK